MQKSKASWAAQAGAVAVLGCATVWAGDWPQWRGPERNGVAKESGLLKEWPEGGPRLVWQVKGVGEGYSTPSVVGDRIYLVSSRGLENESVLALGTKDGKEVWATRIGKVGNPDQQPAYPGARSTPTVDGDRIYALGSDGDLVCLKRDSGEIEWRRNLRSDFGGAPGRWAYAESPLVDGDAVVCTPGGSEATLVALNKKNGEVIWKSQVPGGDEAAYASIIITEADGVKQYVQFLGKGLVGVEAKSGKFLWRYDRPAQGSPANIPTPVADEDYVFAASNRGGGGAIQLEAKNGKFEYTTVYHASKVPNSIGGSVLSGEHLYGTAGSLLCMKFKTGEILWEERVIGAASVCLADGLLFLHGENGEVALVEATPEAARVKGKFTPPDQPETGRIKAWTYPVVANGKLYIRDREHLWCYDVASK